MQYTCLAFTFTVEVNNKQHKLRFSVMILECLIWSIVLLFLNGIVCSSFRELGRGTLATKSVLQSHLLTFETSSCYNSWICAALYTEPASANWAYSQSLSDLLLLM